MKHVISFRGTVLVSLVLFLLGPTALFGQEVFSNEPKWQTVTRNDGEFSVTLPGEWVVQKESKRNDVRILASYNDRSFFVNLRKTGTAKTQLRDQREASENREKASYYKIGDAELDIYVFEGKAYRIAIYLATSKGLYSVFGSAVSADDRILNSVISSIKMSGRPVVKNPKIPPPLGVTVRDADELESSKIVADALNRKQVGKIEVNLKLVPAVEAEEDRLFTRRLLILSKDRPSYTDAARSNNTQGTVKLLLLLKADGDIGKISVVKGLPNGLTQEAIRAAKRIKFLPAQVNGSSVDVERMVEYSFAIY